MIYYKKTEYEHANQLEVNLLFERATIYGGYYLIQTIIGTN